MPTYGYQCTACEHEFSVFQSMKDEPIATCPECTGAVKRLLYPVGIVFRGSGWYINDSRKPDTSEAAEKTAEKKADSTPATSSTTESASKAGSDTKPAGPSA